MKKLNPSEEKFFLIQTKNPTWSSTVCFLHLIRGKKFKDVELVKLFNKFVEKDDYSTKKAKTELVEYCRSQVILY